MPTTHLYAELRKNQALAFLSGERELLDCLSDPDHEGDGVVELVACPPVPRDVHSTVIEIAFPDGKLLEPYLLGIMDAPTTYALPQEILRLGQVRQLAEAEIMDAACESVRNCPPPSSKPLWHWIRETPVAERMEQYGPYLMRAYAKLYEENEPPPTDQELLARLKQSAAKYNYAPGALLLAGETMAEFQKIALIPVFGPYPKAIDEEMFHGADQANWPTWVSELVPPGSKWERLHWPDNSITIRLVNRVGQVLAAKRIPANEQDIR